MDGCATTGAEAVEWEAITTGPLGQQLQQGLLDTATVSPAAIRALMQPSSGEPTEAERHMASLAKETEIAGPGVPARPLLDAATGEVVNLGWLEGLRAEATAASDHERSVNLSRLIEVILDVHRYRMRYRVCHRSRQPLF